MKKALIPIIAIISVLLNSCETVSPRNEETLNNFVFSETVKGENKIEIPSSETGENELDVQHTADRKITNSLYSIDAVDGKYYLNFHDGNEGDTGESNSNAIQVGNIFFSSLAEMQEKLLSGDLSVVEVERLKTLLTNTENGLIFFDVNSLYEINLPQGGGDSFCVYVRKRLYAFICPIG